MRIFDDQLNDVQTTNHYIHDGIDRQNGLREGKK